MKPPITSILLLCFLLVGVTATAQEQTTITIEHIATGLQNPRGLAVLPTGELLVAEAGTGFASPEDESLRTGQISILADLNDDGDYNDPDERTPIITNLASYNALTRFRTGHDEVNGVADLLLIEDRVYFTKDDPLAEFDRNRDDYRGDTGIFRFSLNDDTTPPNVVRILKRPATINAIVHDPNENVFYIAESGLNSLTKVSIEGELLEEIPLPLLDSLQQPVPAGLAFDPFTGDILVALFSGFVPDFYGTVLAYMPGDARIMRYNPPTGELTTAIDGLTTAVDVTTDELGNIYTVELTTTWSAQLMPETFDLFDPDAPPDAGGYTRFSGRITKHDIETGERTVLLENIDTPTNITYHAGVLYVSAGQGTPNRPIWGADGLTQITGNLYKIEGFQ